MFFLFLFKWRDQKLTLNLEEQLENLFGNLNAGAEQKFHRQREYFNKIKSRGNHK